MEAGFILALRTSPRAGIMAPFLLIFGAIFAVYLLAVKLASAGQAAEAPARVILGFAVLFRVTFLFASPALSDDLYRYLWDGRILLTGGNPYLEPPIAAGARMAGDPLYARLSHKEVGTIYPPAAQLLFAAGAALSGGPLGLKMLLLLCDLGVVVALRALLARRRQPASRILIYAWSPLAVIETAWSGHLEAAGLVLVVTASLAIIQGRQARATLALTLAGLVKLLPLWLFAPFARALRARALLVAPLLIAAAFWPFRSAGVGIVSGAAVYARRWSANESLFAAVHAAIVGLEPTPWLKEGLDGLRRMLPGAGLLERLYPYLYPDDLARMVCAVAALAGTLVISARERDPLRAAYLVTGLLLLLSPTVHPWYLLWILPWLCLFPSRAWILLTGLAALAYANLGATSRAAEPYPWLRLAEYLPFYALLAWEAIGPRLVRRRAG